MTTPQIQALLNSSRFIEKYGNAKLIATHISWILLTKDFAFKIKMPFHYSFLNFSTLKKRQFYCKREVQLNRRLAPDMYLGVTTVRMKKGTICLENIEGKIIDYAVKMKRMDESRQMNLLLKKGKVTPTHLQQIAAHLAAFHQKAQRITYRPDLQSMKDDFDDILKIKDFISPRIGNRRAQIIEHAIIHSDKILARHFDRITQRQQNGYVVDGHGDLHSGNIFLPKNKKPVIFDCIEFSDHLRHIDILNELAFFCMDLDFYERADLAEYFLTKYNEHNPCLFNRADYELFSYFKLYRVNVRIKTGALKAMNLSDPQQLPDQLALVDNYLSLMEKYLRNEK